MMMPQQWEQVAHDRLQDWAKEMHNQQLLAKLPQEPPAWRRWTATALVRFGSWLLSRGERVAQVECNESVTLAG